MPEVRAGGGVLWRRGATGEVEVLLVHRPRYDDWSFPKGKCEDEESFLDAAVREVAEESGLHCRVGPPLGEVSYTDRKGRPKVVRYWAMTVESGSFEANDEVDECRWLPVTKAGARLSYAHDAELLERLESARATTR